MLAAIGVGGELLAPVFEPAAWKALPVTTKGLPASPGAASGQAVFTADHAVEWTRQGKKVVLVRKETVPDDIHGMFVSQGVLTATGGMTSHAAVVAVPAHRGTFARRAATPSEPDLEAPSGALKSR